MASYDDDTPLSLAHLSELEVPPAALAGMAAAAGFASIGVRAMPAMSGGLCYPLHEPGPRAALRRALAEAGIGLLCIELIPLDRATDPDAFRPAIEAGAELGAGRVVVTGDDPDPGIVAQKMAALCDIAAPLGMAVDIEFMPFRAVAGLADALGVVARVRRPNAHVLVDALHVFRSRSDLALLARTPPPLIGGLQLCDAAAVAPEGAAELAEEARMRRLLPGDGALDLRALIAALPAAAPLGIEVPLAGRFPSMHPAERLATLARAARTYLRRAVARPDNEE
jgi:sugar phosphate isomerase/epimerase